LGWNNRFRFIELLWVATESSIKVGNLFEKNAGEFPDAPPVTERLSPDTASVTEAMGVGFCCGGGWTIAGLRLISLNFVVVITDLFERAIKPKYLSGFLRKLGMWPLGSVLFTGSQLQYA
jgi:hypothetical protein